MQNFKFDGVTVLSVQLFNKIKRKKKKEHEKTCFAIFSVCYVEIHLYLEFIYFLYVLDIDDTRNGNNLKTES